MNHQSDEQTICPCIYSYGTFPKQEDVYNQENILLNEAQNNTNFNQRKEIYELLKINYNLKTLFYEDTDESHLCESQNCLTYVDFKEYIEIKSRTENIIKCIENTVKEFIERFEIYKKSFYSN